MLRQFLRNYGLKQSFALDREEHGLFRSDSRVSQRKNRIRQRPMLLLARKQPVLALLLAVLNAMIAGNAMSACSLARKITSGFTSDRAYREKGRRKPEAGNSYIKIHFARNRQAPRVDGSQAELHLLDK